MELEEILKIVKSKYKDAYIDKFQDCIVFGKWKSLDNSYEGFQTVECCGINEFYFKQIENNNTEEAVYTKDNIIELKHYLNIEIKWEDLVEYVKSIGGSDWEKDNIKFLNMPNIKDDDDGYSYFTDSGTYYSNYGYYVLARNRSYWNIYNIIKNLIKE